MSISRSASLFLYAFFLSAVARLVRTESVPCDINNPLRYTDLHISQTLPKTNKINKVRVKNKPCITICVFLVLHIAFIYFWELCESLCIWNQETIRKYLQQYWCLHRWICFPTLDILQPAHLSNSAQFQRKKFITKFPWW